MDPVKKEISPALNADQRLVDKTDGERGKDNLGHANAAREGIARDLGEKFTEAVTPDTEKAGDLMDTQTDDFLEAVAGVKPEEAPLKDNASDSPSAMENFGQSVNSILPEIGGDGEDNARTASSKRANEIELKRLEQMKRVA